VAGFELGMPGPEPDALTPMLCRQYSNPPFSQFSGVTKTVKNICLQKRGTRNLNNDKIIILRNFDESKKINLFLPIFSASSLAFFESDPCDIRLVDGLATGQDQMEQVITEKDESIASVFECRQCTFRCRSRIALNAIVSTGLKCRP